jgi:hypothetical protein
MLVALTEELGSAQCYAHRVCRAEQCHVTSGVTALAGEQRYTDQPQVEIARHVSNEGYG